MADVVMASSLEEYEFSGQVGKDVEVESKDVESEVVEAEIEDGELPEEGEICDDEESEEHGHETMEVEDAAAQFAHPNVSLSQPHPRKPRDFDREEVVSARGAESSMMSSWMSGVKQRTKPVNSTIATPTVDANEEYYGYGCSSPNDGIGDKDYRNRAGDAADKDYRWMQEDGCRGPGDVNEFGDSDYRGGSPKLERRRKRSTSPTFGGPKRSRHSPPMRGGFRGRGFRGRWGERQICKFFREGYCRDGENCSYSHSAADSGRKAELCKFYQQGFCKKGLQCPLLHGEYPCKAFHKGECSKDPCQFSHLPLNSFTQPIFDQMMKDDELASRIAIPQGPLKRRVLLPGGPSSSPGVQPAIPVIVAVTADGGFSGSMLPPPAVVVPTLSSAAPPVTISQPQLVIPPPLANQTPYPAFFPHHSVPATTVVNQVSLGGSVLGLAPPHCAQNTTTLVQHYTGSMDKRNSQEEEEDNSFNINKMLEQITAKVKKSDSMEESPASPPMFSSNSAPDEIAPTIPETNVPVWKLHPLDNISTHANIDPQILQMALTDGALHKDPRIKKALASQFDAFTNTLMSATPPSLTQSAQTFLQQHSNVTSAPSVIAQPTVVSAFPKDESNGSKLADPRMSTGRDPRKRTAVVGDPRLVLNSVVDPRLSAPPGYETASDAVEEHSFERVSNFESRRGTGSGWMPQIRVTVDPRQVKRYGIGGYRNEYVISQDHDERDLNRIRGEESKSPSSNPVVTATSVSQAPLSLREKRKNNEYESPLSKIPEKTRWT